MTDRTDHRPDERAPAGHLQRIRLGRRPVALGLVALGFAAIGATERAAAGPDAMGAAMTMAAATPGAGTTCSGTSAMADQSSPATATAAAAAPANQAAAPQVQIANFTFDPATLTVPVGTTVTWVNRDDVPHTVTSDDKTTFASPGLDTDDTFAFRFDKPGTYPYFCSIHPVMTGQVIVR